MVERLGGKGLIEMLVERKGWREEGKRWRGELERDSRRESRKESRRDRVEGKRAGGMKGDRKSVV